MGRFCIGLLSAILFLPPALLAQTTTSKTQSGTGAIAAAPQPKEENKQIPKKSERKNFYLDVGGFYSPFIPGSGRYNWRGWDMRLMYSGVKRFTPFGGMARINNSQGAQITYGVGSYVTFNKWFYVIGGASFAPATTTEFSPHRRYDVAGMWGVPKVKGMVLSTGLTILPAHKNTGAGRILALGDIYYWRKFIFGGNVNINFAEPGNRRSVSGQLSVTYGVQGKYYLAGGLSGGKAAYMLITGVPFEVHYQTVGGFISLTKWFAKHAGVNVRYGYMTIVDSSYQRHSIRIGPFFQF